MTIEQVTLNTLYEGWHAFQAAVCRALLPLTAEQLSLRAAPELRSVGEIAVHMIGARARWFISLIGPDRGEFPALARWDHPDAPPRSAAELVHGLEATWQGMHGAIARWTPEEWQATEPGEDETEPEVITRPWIIWHLMEHDVHHGGEISLTLGVHGLPGLGF